MEAIKTTEFKSFLKKVDGNEGEKCQYPTRLDLYGKGCTHDCSYCYAKSLLEFRKMWNPGNPSVADWEKVRKAIHKQLKPGDIVRLGGMTDCFQPVEKVHRMTLKTIKELNKCGVGYLIVTKSHIVADDEYIEAMDKNLAHIQVSITSTDDEFCHRYEKASPPSKRIQAIEKLQRAGFDVSVRLSPFIPQFVWSKRLDLDIINGIQCDKILVEFLRVNAWVKQWFDIDYSEYTLHQSGYWHLPLEIKRIWISLLAQDKQISVCEDETEAYQFWRHRFNPNPDDCCNLKR